MLTLHRKYKKIIKRLLLFLTLGISFFLLTDYLFFYRPYVQKLGIYTKKWPEPVPPTGVSQQTMSDIGRMQADKKSSFVNFTAVKPAGITRIGCFGCSYTYGAEVGYDEDYPSQLQKLLDMYYPHKYEVINFGSSYHGFFQSYIIYEDIGKKYDLDYVVFGPESFQVDRDIYFNHTVDICPEYIHARFINVLGKTVRISPPGKNISEKIRKYYSFFPAWQYLFFDRTSPALLRAIRIMQIPPSEKDKEETYKLYKKLLLSIYQKDQNLKKVIVVNNNSEFISFLATHIKNPAYSFVFYDNSEQHIGFPYRMPMEHFSVLGNQLIAQTIGQKLIAKEINYYTPFHITNTSTGQKSPDIPVSADTAPKLLLNTTDKIGNIIRYETNNPVYTPASGFKQDYLLFLENHPHNIIGSLFVNTPVRIDAQSSISLFNVTKGGGSHSYKKTTADYIIHMESLLAGAQC